MTQTRIALVTGANKGIGFEIARKLAGAGVHVLIGSRDRARGDAAEALLTDEGVAAESLHLDLDSAETISAAAATIESRFGRLDILVNNAGIFDLGDAAPGKASVEAVRRVMEVNFIGTLAVTQAMLPLLRAAPGATIVNLSSSMGSLAENADPEAPYYSQRFIGYNASKAALNMLTIQLHEELQAEGIKVNSVSPGFVKTDLTGGYGEMTPEEGARLPAEYALEAEVSGRFLEPGGQTPW
ncbi:SDR family oxidoreductase [Ponticoccus alexandrii]|uniref:SDR family NAD(P)-dependent oxidoreductase n=1 Tax=Ponticoccus alexandrii TaxID=1943633 RepID=A0ABX7FAJ5_9RHOB|nr:SDR family oxidoreductase [Ponticoccus alexandrii]ETA51788.1 short-chain dehydrogenase [Rhodobacteraceae bacterium PD-2]QRF67575.1 SDR family NAD(P)-dependent oxidoreductase [Ponticoccus alexandrii]